MAGWTGTLALRAQRPVREFVFGPGSLGFGVSSVEEGMPLRIGTILPGAQAEAMEGLVVGLRLHAVGGEPVGERTHADARRMIREAVMVATTARPAGSAPVRLSFLPPEEQEPALIPSDADDDRVALMPSPANLPELREARPQASAPPVADVHAAREEEFGALLPPSGENVLPVRSPARAEDGNNPNPANDALEARQLNAMLAAQKSTSRVAAVAMACLAMLVVAIVAFVLVLVQVDVLDVQVGVSEGAGDESIGLESGESADLDSVPRVELFATVNAAIEDIEGDLRFEVAFKGSVAVALGVPTTQVHIDGYTPGSTVVSFSVPNTERTESRLATVQLPDIVYGGQRVQVWSLAGPTGTVMDVCADVECGRYGVCSGGYCDCVGNFVGVACDSCAGNFVGEQCNTECDCSGHGRQMDIASARAAGSCSAGSCACTSNFIGAVCDSCTGHFIGEQCSEVCDCSGNGQQLDIVAARSARSCSAGTCACQANFIGAFCDSCGGNFIGDACDTACDCSGNGRQTDIASARDAGSCDAGSCACADGFVGKFCDTLLLTCIHGTIAGGSCECSPGYSGTLCECRAVLHSVGNATCTNEFDSQVTDCRRGYTLVQGLADTCLPNTCSNPTTFLVGFSTLPTCDGRTTGSIQCRQLPECADGFYGSPTIANVTCEVHGAELTVTGCVACPTDGILCVAECGCDTLDCGSHGTRDETSCVCAPGYSGTFCDERALNCGAHGTIAGGSCECSPGYLGTLCECRAVLHSVGNATCTNEFDSQVTDCRRGYTLVQGLADTCLPNTCSNPTTFLVGFSTLPTCDGRTTGSIQCRQLPECADGFYGSPTIANVTCEVHGAELTVAGCVACPTDGILCVAECGCDTLDCGSHGTRDETSCVCAPGYSGTFCDERALNCGAHGTIAGGSCECSPGYLGTLCECRAVLHSVGNATCTNEFDSQVTDCRRGYTLVQGLADTCLPNTCSNPTTFLVGFSTLPTCDGRTTGSIQCRQLPECADGFYGSPTIANVTCEVHGAELTVTGCVACPTDGILCVAECGCESESCANIACESGFPKPSSQEIMVAVAESPSSKQAACCESCAPILHSVGGVSCTGLSDTQAEDCEAGYTLVNAVVDTCVPNICRQSTTAVQGYAALPVCHVRTSGSITCTQLPVCALNYMGVPTLDDITCDADGAELSVSGCELVICTVPSGSSGYVVTNTELNVAVGFDVSVTCAVGYEATNQIFFKSFESNEWASVEHLDHELSSFSWSRGSGETPSSNTGPLSAVDGSHYLFTDSAESHDVNHVLDFVEPLQANVPYSIELWYHMYGSDTGTLAIEMSAFGEDGSWETLWWRSGEQHTSSGAAWTQASVSVTPIVRSAVRVLGATGSGSRSDMAIDGVKVTRNVEPATAVAYSCGAVGGDYALTGCAAVCSQPSVITGYTVTNTELNVARGFDVAVECAAGFEASGNGPAATSCGAGGGDYTLRGCGTVCTQPTDISGYTVTDIELNVAIGFDVAVECDTGFHPTGAGPAAASCGAASGDYTLSGCAVNTCIARTTAVAGFATLPVCEDMSTGSITCSVMPECAVGYTGTPSLADVTCGAHGAELTIAGCRLVVCTEPSDTTGYDVTTTELNAALFDASASCAPGYEESTRCAGVV